MDDNEIQRHMQQAAAHFAIEQPDEAAKLLSAANAMMRWGASQKGEHGYAFFTLGLSKETPLPIAVAGVFPTSLMTDVNGISPAMFDTVIDALTKAKARVVEKLTAKGQIEEN